MVSWFTKRIPLLQRLDHHMKEVVRKAAGVYLLRLVATALGFVLNILIARLFGADGSGAYYLALMVTGVGAMIGRFGLNTSSVRFIAANAGQAKWQQVAGIHRQGMFLALVTSIFATIAIFVSAPWLAERVFSAPELTNVLKIMSLGIIPSVLLSVQGAGFQGLKHPALGTLIGAIVLQVFNIALLFPLKQILGIQGLVTAYVISNTLALMISLVVWHRVTPQTRGLRGAFDFRLLVRTSLPLLLVSSMNFIVQWSDTFMLGIWSSAEDVGIYGIAIRTAQLTSFVLISVNSIVGPKFAELYAQNDLEALGKLAKNSAALLSLLALPFLLVFSLFPARILGIFGAEFTAGAAALIILSLGNFINTATGAVGRLLIMTGHEKLVQYNAIGGTLANIVLNLILIPKFGITGAAIATAVTVSGKNLVAVALVYWKLSILTLPIPINIKRR